MATPTAPTFQTEMDKRDARILRFFVDVQNKTRLETNLQASGTLPSLNSYEVRAMRVVVSPVLRHKARAQAKDRALARHRQRARRSHLQLGHQPPRGREDDDRDADLLLPGRRGREPGKPGLPSHGQPDPMATFRFSEPVTIEPNQNFRVEILFPQGVPSGRADAVADAPRRCVWATPPGPLRLWVVLDGYLTRDVQ